MRQHPVISGVAFGSMGFSGVVLSVRGTAQANSTVSLYLGGKLVGTTQADGNGNWTYQYNTSLLTFLTGTLNFTATATDQAGNVSVLSPTFKLDPSDLATQVSAPTLTAGSIVGYANGVAVTSATPSLTGKAAAGDVVTIVDGDTVLGTAVANASGNWTFTTPVLSSGQQTITVFATNAQGDDGLLSNALTFIG